MNTIKIVKQDVQSIGFAISAQDILEVLQKFFPTRQPAPADKAKVQVASSVPDAEIYVDGNFSGNAPSALLLTAGDHVIEVKASKYADWKRTVSVTSGSDVNIKADLQPQ
jgi:hypothetical protein